MSFPIIRSERAPGISQAGPTSQPGTVPVSATVIDLTAWLGLDPLPAKRRLICHWARETDGWLALSDEENDG